MKENGLHIYGPLLLGYSRNPFKDLKTRSCVAYRFIDFRGELKIVCVKHT